MSGHSKWANIKRKKGLNDVQKGKVFSKLSRLITLAVIEGGGVTLPENNIKLRLAIDKAKQDNMPKENIKRAIEKGVGPDRTMLREELFEAFGPSGIALVILATSDNPNRTLSEIRNVLERHGGKLGNRGSSTYLFKKCGMVTFLKAKNSSDKIFAFAESIQAFDIDEDGDYLNVYFPFEILGKVKEHLGALESEVSELDYKPNLLITIKSNEESKRILSLLNALEDLDDVQKVFSNFIISHEFLNE